MSPPNTNEVRSISSSKCVGRSPAARRHGHQHDAVAPPQPFLVINARVSCSMPAPVAVPAGLLHRSGGYP